MDTARHEGAFDYRILQFCFDFLDLEDVHRLSATTKSAQKLCRSLLTAGNQRSAQRMLLGAVRSAATAPGVPHTEEALLHQMNWLLKFAGTEVLLQQLSTPLLNIPEVPSSVAALLVTAGMRVSYTHLVAAARKGVMGVDVWVVACNQLGVTDGLPKYAVAMCCRRGIDWEDYDVPDGKILDLLHLAVAMRRGERGTTILAGLCNLPAAARISGEAVMELVMCALQFKASERVDLLTQLPAAQALTDTHILQLVEVAVQHKLPHSTSALCSLPGAQALPVHAASGLFHQAAAIKQPATLRALCQLPIAKQLPATCVHQLLEEAARSSNHHKALVLCKLPGAQQLGPAAVVDLLRAALADCAGQSSLGKVEAFCTLPSAQDIDSETLEGLILDAFRSGGGSSSELGDKAASAAAALCKLAPVQKLPVSSIAVLLQADAARLQRLGCSRASDWLIRSLHGEPADGKERVTDCCVQLLCALPAASALPCSVIPGVLSATVGAQLWESVAALLQLPVAKQLPEVSVVQAVRAALLCDPEAGNQQAHTVAAAPCVQGLSEEGLGELIVAAEQQMAAFVPSCARRARIINLQLLLKLCQLPAAEQAVGASTVESLISQLVAKSGVKAGTEQDLVSLLCSFASAADINIATVERWANNYTATVERWARKVPAQAQSRGVSGSPRCPIMIDVPVLPSPRRHHGQTTFSRSHVLPPTKLGHAFNMLLARVRARKGAAGANGGEDREDARLQEEDQLLQRHNS